MDWSGCPAVERISGKVSGQWIVKGTRILADGVLEKCRGRLCAGTARRQVYDGLPVDRVREIFAYAKRQGAPRPV